MPTKCGQKDSKGYFCRWGNHGKKYYYNPNDKASRERARKKADKQGAAAHASGYRGSTDDLDTILGILNDISKSLNNISKIQLAEPSGNRDEEPRDDTPGDEVLLNNV